MNKIERDLLKNKNVEENLKKYYGSFMEINNRYSFIRFSMNYYTCYSAFSEDEYFGTEGTGQIALINNVIKDLVSQKEEVLDDDISKLLDLRETITKKMKDLTCYVDRFNIYEFALNRVEYRFKNDDYPSGYSDENFTRKLMQFIVSDEDNAAVNQKITQVIGQLPIHYTKNKFYEMVSNGLDVYKEGTKNSIDDFIYMIRTVSMLEKSSDMAENYPELEELLQKFSRINFKDIDEQGYKDAIYDINQASEYMENNMNLHMMIQEIINDLLIILYTRQNVSDDNITEACIEIIKDTNLLFMNEESPKSTEEIEDMFIMLEGTQEDIYPKLSEMDITDEIRKSYSDTIDSLGLSREYDIVFMLPKLNTQSLFVELNKEIDDSAADEDYVEQEKEKLFMEYTELFSDSDRMVKRAVMSAALSELPVFFNNISELQDFIYDTLSACTDKAEKLACIEILNGIMEE